MKQFMIFIKLFVLVAGLVDICLLISLIKQQKELDDFNDYLVQKAEFDKKFNGGN